MIKLENVYFKYNNYKEVLKDINLEIQEGDHICIIGKNGSRKIYSCKNYIWDRNSK